LTSKEKKRKKGKGRERHIERYFSKAKFLFRGGMNQRVLSSGLLKIKKNRKSDSHKNTPLETF
jgi:hypothetical protein